MIRHTVTRKAFETFVLSVFVRRFIQINGRVHLGLKVKSSTNHGLISAQVLEMCDKKYLTPIPAPKRMSLDNGRLFKEEALRELPFKQAKYRVIAKRTP